MKSIFPEYDEVLDGIKSDAGEFYDALVNDTAFFEHLARAFDSQNQQVMAAKDAAWSRQIAGYRHPVKPSEYANLARAALEQMRHEFIDNKTPLGQFMRVAMDYEITQRANKLRGWRS